MLCEAITSLLQIFSMASVSSWLTTGVAPGVRPQGACNPSKRGILRPRRSSLWIQSRSPDLKLPRHSSDFASLWRGVLAQRAKLRVVGQVEMEQRVDMIPLTELPYPLDALEPHLSRKTVELQWDKIHRAYVDNLNEQIRDTDLERNSLEEILKISYNNGNPSPVFNNAGQAWNLEFYWLSMQPGGGGMPSGEMMELIDRDFGSFEDFVFEFKQAACTHFGSGWAWLVLKDTKLVIEKTPNAINPLIWGHTPLLVIDLWEHAYFLDYQNRRADYVSTFVEELISWVSVERRLIRAKAFVNLGEPNIPEE